MILGNLKQYEGSVTFNNHEIKTLDENQIIDQVSFIGNNVHIYTDTLANNITLWENFSEEELAQAFIIPESKEGIISIHDCFKDILY